MIGELISRRNVSLAEVKELMKDIKSTSEKGLSYEQNVTYKYANRWAKLSLKKTKELIEALKELNINEELAIKIADILPTYKETVQLLITKEENIDDQTVDKIMACVNKYYSRKTTSKD